MSSSAESRSVQAEASALPAGVSRLISLLVAAAFVVILNETIMSVALPDLMNEFDVPAATAQWLTTAFMLTMAVVIPITGWLLTRMNLRTVFIIAMSTFTAGTAIAAAAGAFEMLVAGRVVQAIGTAIMMPLLMTTVLNVVPASRRGRTMGVISIVIAVAPAIGPTVGGVVLDALTWRWMFLLVLPIAVLALVLGGMMIRNVTDTKQVPLDLLSVVLSAVGFSGLIYGLSSIGEAATGHAVVAPWIPVVIGAVALLVFTLRQLSLKDFALLDLRVFSVGTFTMALLLMLISMMSLFGTIILLPIYMQQVLGHSTLESGLALLPGGLLMGVLGWFVGRAFDRIGARPLVIPGALLASGGLWLMTLFTENTQLWMIVGAHSVLTTGLALLFSPLMTTALGSLPPRLYPHGSALMSTLQQVAAGAGTALFITVMTVATMVGAGAGQDAVTAQMTGVHNALVIGALISLVTIVGVFFLRNGVQTQAPAAEADDLTAAEDGAESAVEVDSPAEGHRS
ncbi:MDR family MFS transporter [Citricoccus sp. NR2]|uniref:MDR family MFS transporter n=1 Tax=Citricoccus sp. NR2 TaxID=3004095 RepID=UPI0022DD9C0A|nr:MDR family MFS transporter [Citricoccus sp. NR2]WBL19441.1 MDR family MFS transporter [Citricoccus sp. NR2]